ncbi:hypothetical protein H8959_005760 [Pygathrix nigripes]
MDLVDEYWSNGLRQMGHTNMRCSLGKLGVATRALRGQSQPAGHSPLCTCPGEAGSVRTRPGAFKAPAAPLFP